VTHEEEARLLFNKYVFLGGDGFFYIRLNDDDSFVNAIATALRKRDELYDAAWGECERWRKEAGYQRWITGNGEWAYMHPNKNDVYLIHEADAHDTLRREAGKEKA